MENKLVLEYDEEYSILYATIPNRPPSYGDDYTFENVTIYRSIEDDSIIGLIIYNTKKL